MTLTRFFQDFFQIFNQIRGQVQFYFDCRGYIFVENRQYFVNEERQKQPAKK